MLGEFQFPNVDTPQDDSPERDPARPRPAPWGSTGKFLESVELCVD